MERIIRMAERARYDGRRGSSTRSTKAPRWYMPVVSRVLRKVSQPCSMLLGAGNGLFALVDIPVRTRICWIILGLLTTLLLLLSAVSNAVAYTAQQGQN